MLVTKNNYNKQTNRKTSLYIHSLENYIYTGQLNTGVYSTPEGHINL